MSAVLPLVKTEHFTANQAVNSVQIVYLVQFFVSSAKAPLIRGRSLFFRNFDWLFTTMPSLRRHPRSGFHHRSRTQLTSWSPELCASERTANSSLRLTPSLEWRHTITIGRSRIITCWILLTCMHLLFSLSKDSIHWFAIKYDQEKQALRWLSSFIPNGSDRFLAWDLMISRASQIETEFTLVWLPTSSWSDAKEEHDYPL